MLQFNQQSSATGNRELIPGGTLAWAILTVKGMKIGAPKDGQNGSRFAECEFTISEGQFEKRKIFTNVGDPTYVDNSDKYKEMGYAALSRMAESSGIVNVQDVNSYTRLNGQSFDTLMAWLDGKRIAIKIRVEKGQQGYPDKNSVGEFLAPNPVSSSFKDFQKLIAQAGMPAAGAPAPAAAPAWGQQASAPAAAPAAQAVQNAPLSGPAAQPSFGLPQAGQQAAPAGGNPANPTTAAWLQQANGNG